MQALSSGTDSATRWGSVLKPATLAAIVLTICSCSASRPCTTDSASNPGTPGPPHPCRMDGCSMAPDFDFGDCCDLHDARYWSGGSAEERKRTDQEFRECIIGAGHPFTARIYYYAVRAAGTPHLPTRWRWGFGWDYPRGYTDPPEIPGSAPENSE